MSSSLGRRIVVAATLSTAIAVALAGAVMWLTTRTVLLRNLDRELNERAGRFTQRGGWMLRSDRLWRHFTPPEFQAESGTWFLLCLAENDGHELIRSPSLAMGTSLATLPAVGRDPVSSTLPDGRALRIISILVPSPPPAPVSEGRPPDDVPPPPPAILYLACATAVIDEQLRQLITVLVGTCIVATTLAAAVSAWLARTVLKPVHALSQAITSAEPTRPGARIGLDGAPRELQPLVDRLNELFARVEAAFQRERTTIADIAHELRTPVTVLRTTLEFSLAREHPPHSREVQERCLRTAIALQGMITTLLLLARLEAGQEPVAIAPLDAAAVLHGCWDLLRERSEASGQSMDWRVPELLPMCSAEDKLRIIITNLLDNAVSHGGANCVITLSAEVTNSRLRMTVANPITSPAIDVDSVFTPFWRGDSSRTGTSHSGLGLALARRVAGVLGGTLTAVCADGQFTVILDLPAQS